MHQLNRRADCHHPGRMLDYLMILACLETVLACVTCTAIGEQLLKSMREPDCKLPYPLGGCWRSPGTA